MTKKFLVLFVIMTAAAACSPTAPTPTPPTPPPLPQPTTLPQGYRPLQKGDVVEGSTIDYQYILPSEGQPVIDIAFGQNLLQLSTIKPQLADGLVAFAKDLVKEPHNINGFDETNPNQREPRPITLEANKPVEIVFVPFAKGNHYWNVTETQQGDVRAAFKLVRRQDGGLRFINAYDLVALNNFGTLLPNGGGGGLVFSARLALLQAILSDPAYQRGENVIDAKTPAPAQYDPRVLKVDPSKEGLAQNVDWVIQSRPVPNPGQISP